MIRLGDDEEEKIERKMWKKGPLSEVHKGGECDGSSKNNSTIINNRGALHLWGILIYYKYMTR